ncbi:hypothetical protein ACPC54_24970 [Kitasatospora sp. NPDC094028]
MGLKLTGRSVKARKIARDAKGLPIRMAKPLFAEEEWAAVQAAMDERSVTKERSNGASPWLGVVQALEVLVDERRRLAALPQRPSAWVEAETGQTFADAWARADQEHRRQLLLGFKARLYMTPTTDGWYLPAELEARARQLECAGSST